MTSIARTGIARWTTLLALAVLSAVAAILAFNGVAIRCRTGSGGWRWA